jgi:ribosomal protein L29
MKTKNNRSLVELRKALTEAQLRLRARQEKNTNLAKNLRREIARKETENHGQTA